MSSIVFNDFKKRFLEGAVPQKDNWNFSLMNRNFNRDFNEDNFSLEQFRTTADLDIFSKQRGNGELRNYTTDGNLITYTWTKVDEDEDFSNKPMFVNAENLEKFKESSFWKFFEANTHINEYIKDDFRGNGFYVIRSKDELSWFANRTKEGNNKIIGVLADNITGEINNIIGKEESYPFMGILDGNGFILKGIKLICDSVNNGIVGVLGEKGIVRNFEISNDDNVFNTLACTKRINLKHIKEDGRNVYAGILVGKNFGTIENIYVKENTNLDISGFIPQVYSVTNKSDDYNDFMEIRKKYSNSVSENFYYLNSFCINSPGNICPYVGYFNEGLFGENILFKNSKKETKRRLNLKTSDMGGYYLTKFINSDNYNGMKFESGNYANSYSYCLNINEFNIKRSEDEENLYQYGYRNTIYNCEFVLKIDSNDDDSEEKITIFIKIPGNIKFLDKIDNTGKTPRRITVYNFYPGDLIYNDLKNNKQVTFKEICYNNEYKFLKDSTFDWSQFYGGDAFSKNFTPTNGYGMPEEDFKFVIFNKNTDSKNKIKFNDEVIFELTENNSLKDWRENDLVQIWVKQGKNYTFFKTTEQKKNLEIDLFNNLFERKNFIFQGMDNNYSSLCYYLFRHDFSEVSQRWIFDDGADIDDLKNSESGAEEIPIMRGIQKFCEENTKYKILENDTEINHNNNDYWKYDEHDEFKVPEFEINFKSFINSLIYKPFNYNFSTQNNESDYIENLKKNLYTGLDKNGDFTSELLWRYESPFNYSNYSFVDYNWNLRLSEFKQIPSGIEYKDDEDVYEDWNFLKAYYDKTGFSAKKFQILPPSAREEAALGAYFINSAYYNTPFKLPKMSRVSYDVGTLVGHNKGVVSSVVINGLNRKNTSNFVGFIGGIAGSQDKGTISNVSAIITDDFNEKYPSNTYKYDFTSAEYSAMKEEGYMVTYNTTPIIPEGALSRTNLQYSYSEAISSLPQWFSAYKNKNEFDVSHSISFKLRPIFNIGGIVGRLSLSNPFTNSLKPTYANNFKNINLKYTNKRENFTIDKEVNNCNNANVYSNYGTLFGKIEYNYDDINVTNVSASYEMMDIKYLGVWENKDYSTTSGAIDAIGKVEFDMERLQNIHRFSAYGMNTEDATKYYVKQPFLAKSDDINDSTIGPESLMDYCLDIPMFHNICNNVEKQNSGYLFHYTTVGSASDEDNKYYNYGVNYYPGYLFLSGNANFKNVSGNNISFNFNLNKDFYNSSKVNSTEYSSFSATNETYKTYYKPQIFGKENNILVSISGETEGNTKRIYGFNTSSKTLTGEGIMTAASESLENLLGKTYEKNKIFNKDNLQDEYYYYTYSSNFTPVKKYEFSKDIQFLNGPSEGKQIHGYVFEDVEDPYYEFDTDKIYNGNYINIGKTLSPSEIRTRLNNLRDDEQLQTSAFSANTSAGFGGILVTDSSGNNIMYIENEDEVELNGNSWYYKLPSISSVGQHSKTHHYGMVLEVE